MDHQHVTMKQYMTWALKISLSLCIAPFRALATITSPSSSLRGFYLLLATVFFIVLITLQGVSRPRETEQDFNDFVKKLNRQHGDVMKSDDDDVMKKVEFIQVQPTARDPDPLTFKLIEKIFVNMSDAEQVSLAYKLHLRPEALLMERKIRNKLLKEYERVNKKDTLDNNNKINDVDEQNKKLEGTAKSNSSLKKPILCVKPPHGNMRLGNILFMYASTFSLAKDTNHTLTTNGSFSDLKAIFKNIEYVNRKIGNEIGAIMPRTHATYEPIKIPANEDVCVSGYLQSWRYFNHHTSELKSQLTFPEATIEKVEQNFRKLLKPVADRQGVMHKDLVKVCVHVRRGDMLDATSKNAGYKIPNATFYFRAMLYFYIQHPHSHFIVVTDDIKWAQEIFADFIPRIVTLNSDQPTADPVFDLASLASCDHVIGSVGSYSWWGGWLSGGKVIMYNEPHRNGSELANGFNRDDYFPPDWGLMGN